MRAGGLITDQIRSDQIRDQMRFRSDLGRHGAGCAPWTWPVVAFCQALWCGQWRTVWNASGVPIETVTWEGKWKGMSNIQCAHM